MPATLARPEDASLDADTLRRVEDAVLRLLTLSPSEREWALVALGREDPAVEREARSLLKHAANVTQFLATPALGTNLDSLGFDTPQLAEDLSGVVIGAYKLTSKIATGGMGAVYRAARVDGQFEQEVAVKIVKRGMDTDEIFRRFVHERQTLANLNHPNIARLIDGGVTESGRPYLVMEFIAGIPIDEFVASHTLNFPARLALFRTVCDAVRFAHQNLVVHRDLKPSNILVTPDGVPKLLDFGIAKVLKEGSRLDQTYTSPAERLLTPEYASPEQIRGQIVTTSTDVYSLGVILYELLVGTRPYSLASRTTAELERVVCEQTPPLPSTVSPSNARALRGDLDTIITTAMRKEPHRRYASVEALLADLDRFVNGFPILARPDTLAYRASKFIRRNTLACALTSVAAAGIGIYIAQSIRVKHQRDEAYSARDQSEAITAFLSQMLRPPAPIARGRETRVADVLDHALIQADSELSDRPLVHAAVESSIGRTWLELGEITQAETSVRDALARREALLPPGHHDIAESKLDLAEVLFRKEDFDGAARLATEALNSHRRLRGEANLDTARCYNTLGAIHRAMSQLDDAEADHRTALRIRQEIMKRSTGAEHAQAELDAAESLNNLAVVRRLKGDALEAIERLEQALELRLKHLPADHPLVIQSETNLGLMYLQRDRFEDAQRLYAQAMPGAERVYGSTSAFFGTTLRNYAQLQLETGDPQSAIPNLNRAISILSPQLGEDSMGVVLAKAHLLRAFRVTRQFSQGESTAASLDALLSTVPTLQGQLRAVATHLYEYYDAAGHLADADRWRQRLADSPP